MNLNDFLTLAAHAHGDRPAVELSDQQLTFAELHALAGRTAARPHSSRRTASDPATGSA
ncbi:hypothetical protein GT030_16275 [Streptomyces sp. SID1328]|uniref:hypothetical protein n=1 Tax=Streptomyces sp. SID1328 TaxID=2690250 RepID=UPI0013722996|nr:hypothetical protein [Streptomyces sp. SID1328]MYV40378.1 hypothetical protein [Streptomyces sp. SID1328]